MITIGNLGTYCTTIWSFPCEIIDILLLGVHHLGTKVNIFRKFLKYQLVQIIEEFCSRQ